MKTRTTVSLDLDVFELVREESFGSRRKFGEAFKVEPFSGKGFAAGVDEKKLNQLLDRLETEGKGR